MDYMEAELRPCLKAADFLIRVYGYASGYSGLAHSW